MLWVFVEIRFFYWGSGLKNVSRFWGICVFRSIAAGAFCALLLLKRCWGFAQAPQGLCRFAPALAARAFFRAGPQQLVISLSAQRNETKKSAGYAPELKNLLIFLNEKNSLRSNSFSFLTENTRFFFTLLH